MIYKRKTKSQVIFVNGDNELQVLVYIQMCHFRELAHGEVYRAFIIYFHNVLFLFLSLQ